MKENTSTTTDQEVAYTRPRYTRWPCSLARRASRDAGKRLSDLLGAARRGEAGREET